MVNAEMPVLDLLHPMPRQVEEYYAMKLVRMALLLAICDRADRVTFAPHGDLCRFTYSFDEQAFEGVPPPKSWLP